MKNTCIVLRNVNSSLSTIEYSSIVDSFMIGGFPIDRISLLSFDVVGDLCDAIDYQKKSSDNIFFIADSVLIPSLKGVLSKYLQKDFSSEYCLKTETVDFYVCPSGTRGVDIVKGQILPALTRKYGVTSGKLLFRMIGVPMKKIQKAVTDVSDLSRNTIGFNVTESYGDIRLEIVYGTDTPAILVDSMKRVIVENLNDYIYSFEDESIEERLFRALKMQKKRISVAESFTGGGVASRLVSIPGISELYIEGLNTYSNESKMNRLGVERDTLSTYGAVSDQTAYEMAAGLQADGCDVAISTTGIAGPDSDGTGKPVGLCYIGVGVGEQIFIYKFNIAGDREKVTKTAINYALFQAYKAIC